MIRHYLKVAWRNLLRYKTQSIISIVGLAVGFTCFALATLWIRYEMTYDSFHPDANRIYMLYDSNHAAIQKYSLDYPAPLANRLMNEFPEIESCCAVPFREYEVQTGQQPYILRCTGVDSCFIRMFNIRLLAGSMDFLNSEDKLAVTPETAVKLFGSEKDVVGRTVECSDGKRVVCAVVQGWGRQTNLAFDALNGLGADFQGNWRGEYAHILLKLKEGVEKDVFGKKLYKHVIGPETMRYVLNNMEIMPITQCRYTVYADYLPIQFQYLILFCITGGLVILCVLLNYLFLFTARLRIRIREMALRKVCGSSNGRLYALLSIEFVLTLSLASLVGMVVVELSLPYFRELSGVEGDVYTFTLLYLAGALSVAMLMFLLVLNHFNRRSMQQAIKGGSGRAHSQFFNRVSLVMQMVISVLFVFCMAIIMKQLYYLHYTDIGMERKNIATMAFWEGEQAPVVEHIKQMPVATEVLDRGYTIIPAFVYYIMPMSDWEGKQPSDDSFDMTMIDQGEFMMPFYRFRLLKGKALTGTPEETHSVVINETAAKRFGWDEPIGKTFIVDGDRKVTVVGLIKDFHVSAPTVPVVATMITSSLFYKDESPSTTILMKYSDNQWPVLRSAIDSLMAHNYPAAKYSLFNLEEEYEQYLKSEKTLLKLLSIVAVVCVLVSTFGIYSFVTLTCERRRKEIAIRKVNGAKVSHILLIFLKEYTLLLLIASTIAFSVGYALMKRWLESYVEQTPISWWVYCAVFAGIAFVVLLSIGSRVWIAANQNPAEVIKSE